MVLHAHLPYIRHFDRDDVMEERWFYEAMTETYLPLLDVFDGLVNDGVDFRITMSVTPTLMTLCADSLMQERYAAHLDRLIGLADKERIRLEDDERFYPLAAMYAEKFRLLKSRFESCGRNVMTAFRRLQDMGKLEIMTSAATHGYLPLMKTEEAIRAQIRTGVREYERHFGRRPSGIWLPECGYTAGIDRILKMEGLDYFIADSTAVAFATPAPNRNLLGPLMTPYGVTAFPRDPESSEQVWSSTDGYPGHYDYREYYRDIGWDLGWNDPEEWEYIRPYVLPTNERINTGMKYYRITGRGQHREPYNPEWARKTAAEHAGHFLFNREKQAEAWSRWLDRLPIIVSPYDAELFGHWWYEGPIWIDMLCRKIFHDQQTIKMITPSEYLRQYPVADTGRLNESSWGRNHSSEVWLQENNDWIYRHLHEAEERMVRLATRHAHLEGTRALPASALKRALNQAVRELLLAQGSDWAFIMDSRTVVEYAVRRTKDHLGCFDKLCGMIEAGKVDETFLDALERKDDCFPDADYRDYVAVRPASPVPLIPDAREWERLLKETADGPNTFMLAWEYPPKYVGGLSRAVADLAEALAARGEKVHVVTTSFEGAPAFERQNGVYVHRVPVLCSGDTDFYHWTFEMNLAMVDHLVAWKENGGRIDVLHAHDWMVFHAARELKHSYGLPLVATIHATEWGRQQGKLHGELQHRIHGLEWRLTYEASRVFVCSAYMKEEVVRLFQLPEDKVDVVPNGIRIAEAPDRLAFDGTSARRQWFADSDRIILYVGRLVYEKGVHVLLEAMPHIIARAPGARLVVAGAGPMRESLERRAAELGLGDRASFWGFVDDETKARLYAAADVCVFPSLYEPFGIVALEAMASRTPLVVSDVGGLAELVEHGVDGYRALPGHVESLAWHVTELLLAPESGGRMASRAYGKLRERYDPDAIAAEVQRQYDRLTYRTAPVLEATV
ncbi:1,4-alpha-glucan branching protein domain-containing protein [Paenibacillus flagellatus]|uniref:1,4-alpha-glucan branching protein domain-containing protein n=1 Tax=Paenibacillus flagellatus TaxID=2211139 RepID=UPI00319DA84B